METVSLSEDPFIKAGNVLAAHPFLQEAGKGNLSSSVWAAYVGNRLGAGGSFVDFLTMLETAALRSFPNVAYEVGKNRAEELGLINGTVKVDRALCGLQQAVHAKTAFLNGMERFRLKA
jgi:hypothetical protein